MSPYSTWPCEANIPNQIIGLSRSVLSIHWQQLSKISGRRMGSPCPWAVATTDAEVKDKVDEDIPSSSFLSSFHTSGNNFHCLWCTKEQAGDWKVTVHILLNLAGCWVEERQRRLLLGAIHAHQLRHTGGLWRCAHMVQPVISAPAYHCFMQRKLWYRQQQACSSSRHL